MSNLLVGRVNQKRRTRDALLQAGVKLLALKEDFTIADVADIAQVGRTTAYRYFPNIEALIAHASFHAVTEMEQGVVTAAMTSAASPRERLRIVFEESERSRSRHSFLYRTMLRMSLSKDPKFNRSQLRGQLLEMAIGDLRGTLDETSYEQLLSSLTLLLGIESEVAYLDVCRLSRRRALETRWWAAEALLDAALARRK